MIGQLSSTAAALAAALPQVHIVKAFDSSFAQVLAEGADFGGAHRADLHARR